MTFLVVDDSPTMRRIVCNALREIGYSNFLEAEDGVQALGRLEATPPNLVITGWTMPNMDGIELTRSIRSHGEHGALPILMITTRGMQEDVLEAMDARVSDYVVRPFTTQTLRHKVGALVGDPASEPLASEPSASEPPASEPPAAVLGSDDA